MAVSAVQKNQNKPHKINYAGAAVVGAIGGYSLKYLSPLTAQEKNDDYYKYRLNKIKSEAKLAKEAKLIEIRNAKDCPDVDQFIKMYDNQQLKASKIKALKEPLSYQVLNLVRMVNNEARETIIQGKKDLKASIKDIRPTKTFVLLGMGISLLTALACNVSREMSKNSREKLDDLD